MKRHTCFVSSPCAYRLNFPIHEMRMKLVVSTSTSSVILTSLVYIGCPIEIERHKFKVNLICLPLIGVYVILGMDLIDQFHGAMMFSKN